MTNRESLPVLAAIEALSRPRCRRCSDCVGAPHHWIDNWNADAEEDATHECRHCDAMGDECAMCGGDGEVNGAFVSAVCPACDGHGVTERLPDPSGEANGANYATVVGDPREGKRAERSTGTHAEQRAGGLRGISAPRACWHEMHDDDCECGHPRVIPDILADTREVIAARRQACYGALQITDAQIDELARALVQMWQMREAP